MGFPLSVLKHGYSEVDALLHRFSFYLRAMGRSGATVRAYLAVVARYAEFAARVPVDMDPVQRYVATRRGQVAVASVNLEISALKTWFQWLRAMEPDQWQPTAWPKSRRPPARVVRALTDAEVGQLLAAPDLSTFVGLRDHAIMATLYQCGLRASELVSLELGSIRLDGLLYVRGKGAVDRLVPFGGAWHGLMESYIRQRAMVRPGKRSALFVSRRGKALRNGRSVWAIVNRYARRTLGLACGYARLEAHARGRPWQGHYPHLLRASFATELLRSGCNLVAIAQMLGHADVATTAHYLGVDLDMLRAAVSHHPRVRRSHESGGA